MKNIFNGIRCPHRLVDNRVKKFNPMQKKKNGKNENNRCIGLQFEGIALLDLEKAVISQFTIINFHCIVNIITFKFTNYFQLKDATLLTLEANVVHCLKGSCDKTQCYIGRTK